MKLKSDRKNYVIMGLCAILLVMSIGYAAFSSLLTINGTASVSDSFCVGFDNTKTNTYAPTAGITNGTLPTGSMSYSGTACSTNYQPNSSLSATFKQPGDKIEYTLTIANKSTFTVAIESILVENQSVTSNTTITKGNIKYIVEMPLTTTLASNAETTMKITAMFQNDTDVTGQYSGESQTLNVKINAEQGDSGSTPTPASFTGTIYRNNTNKLANGLTMNGDSTIYYPSEYYSSAQEALNDGWFYINESECLNDYETNGNCASGVLTLSAGNYVTDASELNKTYYLKHTIADNIVTASYVCFVYNNAEHCMQGGINEDSSSSKSVFEANTQIIKDFQTFNNLPDNESPGCYFDSAYSSCNGNGFNQIITSSNGEVYVRGPSAGSCFVGTSSTSNCSE